MRSVVAVLVSVVGLSCTGIVSDIGTPPIDDGGVEDDAGSAGGGSAVTGGGSGSTGGGSAVTGGGSGSTGGGSTVTGGGSGSTGGGSTVTGGGSGSTGGGSTVTGGGSGSTGGGSTVTGGGSGSTGGGSASVDAGVCSDVGGTRAEQVCRRWKCDRLDMSEGTWNGAVNTCSAGDIGPVGRANTLKILNLYRFLANLPEVTNEATRDSKAQECALNMDANNRLDHYPDAGSVCWTPNAYEAAGKSNICSGPSVRCIDLYMDDYGNDSTLGHRRWFMSNQLGPVGIGGTPGGSCNWVIGGTGTAGRNWQPYPPEGPVPMQIFQLPAGNVPKLDQTGWTVQTYTNAWSLVGATVAVTDNGTPAPVTVTTLLNGYGSPQAIKFSPNGWSTTAGHTYDVTVTRNDGGIINYQVQPILCP